MHYVDAEDSLVLSRLENNEHQHRKRFGLFDITFAMATGSYENDCLKCYKTVVFFYLNINDGIMPICTKQC